MKTLTRELLQDWKEKLNAWELPKELKKLKTLTLVGDERDGIRAAYAVISEILRGTK
jgi:hypothetical protein